MDPDLLDCGMLDFLGPDQAQQTGNRTGSPSLVSEMDENIMKVKFNDQSLPLPNNSIINRACHTSCGEQWVEE